MADDTPINETPAETSAYDSALPESEQALEEAGIAPELNPDELPPVQPPSAGFIVQLFLVPGLIVLVILGVYTLFWKLSSSEQDWRSLVTDLRSKNEHIRWQAALGLAQVLKADQERGEKGQNLASNSQVASELSGLLSVMLADTAPSEDDLKQQEFLARTLSLLDAPQTVLPVLRKAMETQRDREVRKYAITSIATIADRVNQKGKQLEDDGLVTELIEVSKDEDPFVRQLGAYALGLFKEKAAQERLEVLLASGDNNTRINAALGLSRQKSTAGFQVFLDVLNDAAKMSSSENAMSELTFEKAISLKNVLKAVTDLEAEFNVEQKSKLAEPLKTISEEHPDAKSKIDAGVALKALS
ncbi:MAG: hypothetical protein CMJ78_22330 [Planctomycetaceae bacterium]|nr:hypothetical protein [Planctomycetaceae bacterium]